MNSFFKYFLSLYVIASLIYATQFELVESSNSTSNIMFHMGEVTFQDEGEYKRIVNLNGGTFLNEGMPEIPIYSTFFQIKSGVTYEIDYIVHNSYTEENIYLYPEQSPVKSISDQSISKNITFYNSNVTYPEKNLVVSEELMMRDVRFLQISFSPFQYHPNTNQLQIFNEVEIIVTESGEPSEEQTYPISASFEKVYESVLINYERDENADYQRPTILYIGPSSALSNSYFQDLVEWREQMGYIVYTASTSETGTSTTSIKNYIQDQYDNPDIHPEFVTLVGDVGGSYSLPAFYENITGYGATADHPYSELEGSDMYPDIFLGRISVRNTNELNVVCNKIIHYEKATYTNCGGCDEETGTDWYEAAALIGDPGSSGNSTIITNEYIAEVLDAYGFEDIREKYSGSFSSWMENQLTDGVAYFNYRGWWGTSGFGNNDTEADNGWKLPFATVLTCGTGSFGDENESMSEAFLRAGTITAPEGGIASVGTATLGTHTMFNNAVNMGIYEGLFQIGAQTTGEGLFYGKLHLLLTYPSNSNYTAAFLHWNNLMGDAATHLWKDTPQEFEVDHLSIVPAGTNYITIDANTEGARVTLNHYHNTSIVSDLTGSDGTVTFDLSVAVLADVTVTITKQDYIPYQNTFTISDDVDAVNVDFDACTNCTGTFTSGSTISLSIPLKNYGSSTINGVNANLTSGSDNVTIVSDFVSYGIIPPGATESNDFDFQIDPAAIEMEDLDLKIEITDNSGNEWSSIIPLNVSGVHLIIDDVIISGDGILNPGETADVSVALQNIGSLSAAGISGSLSGSNFTITDGNITFGTIAPGGTATTSDVFTLTANDAIINGSNLTLDLFLSNDAGYSRSEPLHMQIGVVSVMDPLGPDTHGYYIFDSGDVGYLQAPYYDWIEIDPDLGGSGTSLSFNDPGFGNYSNTNNTTKTVDLDFTFTFYGVPYDQISISSNGWICFGETDLASFRNYSVPGAGGPLRMVAAFWDDLKTSNSGQVYRWYDPVEDQYIIEWSGMRTYQNNSVETFQIILMNNGVPPYGDGEIKIQYKDFDNDSFYNGSGTHGAYSTVGIENHMGDDGLQYTFNNMYPTAAMTLSDGDALLITTDSGASILMGDVNQDAVLNIQDIIIIINDIINLEGQELTGLEEYIADLTEDGIVNILDLIMIVNIILQY